MPANRAIRLDNVTLIRPALCTERITMLDAATMDRVCVALGHAIAC